MDRALAVRLDVLVVLVSLLLVGGTVAVFALGVARGGYGGLEAT